MFLEVSQLEVRYAGRSQAAVQGVTLGLRAGDIGVLIGPSGCGKTSLLRCIAGLERLNSGRILIEHEPLADAARRGGYQSDVGYWFCYPEGRTQLHALQCFRQWLLACAEPVDAMDAAAALQPPAAPA